MAEWEIDLLANEEHKDSNLNNLKLDMPFHYPDYALCLPRYSKLNGQYRNVKTIDKEMMPYISKSISDENGRFKSPPTITMLFTRRKTSDGIRFLFNERSNDYCNDLTIKWFRNDRLVQEQRYKPHATSYYCKAKVGLFNKVVISFNGTNKPYRYLFITQMFNSRLTRGEGLKIVYEDTAYKAKEGAKLSQATYHPISNTDCLMIEKGFKNHPNFASCLPRYSKLDGTFENIDGEVKHLNDAGFVSDAVSNQDGVFKDVPFINFKLNKVVGSIGIHLMFNDKTNDYCSEVEIEWKLKDAVVEKKRFTPTSYNAFCHNPVDRYDQVTVKFLQTSKPFRPVFLNGFAFGLHKVFRENEITKCKVYQEVALLGSKQPISTLKYDVISKDVVFRFENAQFMTVFFDELIIGEYYLKNGTRKEKYNYSISAENVIALLDSQLHAGGFYKDALVSDVIKNEIFANIHEVPITIDDSMADAKITGWLPYGKARNNLAQICLATGAVIDTSFERGVYVYKYSEDAKPKMINDSEVYDGKLKLKNDKIVTGVDLTLHTFTKKQESEEKDQLYEGELNGEKLIKFNEPQYDLECVGADVKIVSSGDNYAIIKGTGQVELLGRGYERHQEIVNFEDKEAYNVLKTVKVSNATLVNKENLSDVIKRIYNYHHDNLELKADIILDEQMLTDMVTVNTFDGHKTGIIYSMDLGFFGEMKAGVKIKCI